MEYSIERLHENGIAVTEFPDSIRESFNLEQFVREQVEFVDPNMDDIFVMGGFGALATPSSYHHPIMRKLRTDLCNYTKEHFRRLYKDKYFEFLPDRFAIRRPGTSLSPESWHRDISNVTKNNEIIGHSTDIIYGGWVNLDVEQTQYFSCVPRSHNIGEDTGNGFSKIDKEQSRLYKKQEEKIAVPPGHMIIFNEKTVHRIAAITQKNLSVRVFMKYKISSFPEPLFPEEMKQSIIRTQGLFPVSISQVIPPIYAALHAAHWKDRLETFSDTIKTNFHKSYYSKKNKTTECRVARFLPSLLEAGVDLYDSYSEEELEILEVDIL